LKYYNTDNHKGFMYCKVIQSSFSESLTKLKVVFSGIWMPLKHLQHYQLFSY